MRRGKNSDSRQKILYFGRFLNELLFMNLMNLKKVKLSSTWVTDFEFILVHVPHCLPLSWPPEFFNPSYQILFKNDRGEEFLERTMAKINK